MFFCISICAYLWQLDPPCLNLLAKFDKVKNLLKVFKVFSPAGCMEEPRIWEETYPCPLWGRTMTFLGFAAQPFQRGQSNHSHCQFSQATGASEICVSWILPWPTPNELLTDGIIVFACIEDVQNANQYLSSEEVYKGWLVTMGSTDRAFISLSASGFAFIIKRAKDMTLEIIYTGRYSFSPVVSEQVSLQLLFLKLINYFESAT